VSALVKSSKRARYSSKSTLHASKKIGDGWYKFGDLGATQRSSECPFVDIQGSFASVRLFCGCVWLFRGCIGLFCSCIGLFGRYYWSLAKEDCMFGVRSELPS